jgi:hypothetical protein
VTLSGRQGFCAVGDRSGSFNGYIDGAINHFGLDHGHKIQSFPVAKYFLIINQGVEVPEVSKRTYRSGTNML